MMLKDLIANELAAGLRPADIAAKLNCSRPYVSIVKWGRDADRKRLNRKEQIQIAFLWGSDVSPDRIAMKLGITLKQTIRFIEDEGLLNVD